MKKTLLLISILFSFSLSADTYAKILKPGDIIDYNAFVSGSLVSYFCLNGILYYRSNDSLFKSESPYTRESYKCRQFTKGGWKRGTFIEILE